MSVTSYSITTNERAVWRPPRRLTTPTGRTSKETTTLSSQKSIGPNDDPTTPARTTSRRRLVLLVRADGPRRGPGHPVLVRGELRGEVQPALGDLGRGGRGQAPVVVSHRVNIVVQGPHAVRGESRLAGSRGRGRLRLTSRNALGAGWPTRGRCAASPPEFPALQLVRSPWGPPSPGELG